jgi:phage shock protein E
MPQSARFQKLVADAKARIVEVTPAEGKSLQDGGALLVDVREAEEFAQGHARGAVHLSRGKVEMKIEEHAPAMDVPIVCYCGGGGRSALVAASLQSMGYTNVRSVAGGFKAWQEQGLPTE